MAFKLIVQNSKILLKSVANYIINATGIKDLFTGDSSIDSNGKINWTLQHYADTAANFTSANPTLLVGQIGIETDNLLTTPKFKIGDGANDWNTLPYANSTSGGTWGTITGTLSNQTDLQTALNAKEDTANKSTNVNTDQASNTKYPSVKAVYDWATGLFVKKGTLTANYIPKSTASDTIGNSAITNVGDYVGINKVTPVNQIDIVNTNSQTYHPIQIESTRTDLSRIRHYNSGATQTDIEIKNEAGGANALYLQALSTGDVAIDNRSSSGNILFTNVGVEKLAILSSGNVRVSSLTASQIVETDASKNLVSAAKGTAYNKDFGTGTTNVPAIGSTLGNSLITSTDANGKLQTLTTATYPSLTELSYTKGVTSAIQTQIDSKLTAANNLSDLANPLTARNNLKEWDLYITSGNQSTTSNVATNITDLVSPTLTASKRYRIHGVIKVGCNNTGGIRFQITLPSGASMDIALSGSNTSNTAYINATLTSSATLSAQVNSFNGLSMLRVDGEISLGVTAGTIQFGFASGTNTQTSTVYQLGTHITLRQLD